MEAVNVEEAIAVGVRVTIGMVIGGILHRSTEVLTKALGTLGTPVGTRALLSGGLGINFIQENDVVLLGNMTVVHMEDKLKLKQQCGHIQV